MQIWRMRPDGSGPEQVTSDEFNNWFPHLSPEGKRMVFLSYEKGVTDHPPDKDVMLRIMRALRTVEEHDEKVERFTLNWVKAG